MLSAQWHKVIAPRLRGEEQLRRVRLSHSLQPAQEIARLDENLLRTCEVAFDK